MKRKFFAFIALITATLSLSSCLSSDETTVEYTHDTAITAFSLGSLDRYTKTKAGKDTLLKANVKGSDYKFYIDQAQRKIYNVDSLPAGTRTAAVLATITSKNSSPVILMHAKQTANLDSAAYYSSTDSINFSEPRLIRVYSSDYSAYAEYQVTVNVHKELPYEFKWHELAQNNSQLAAFSDLKAVACGDYIYVFGKTTDGTEVLKSAINNGSAWSSITMNVGLSSDAYQSAVALDGKLYISDAGKVYASADAETWTEVSENADIKQLIGASSKYLYAYTAAGISVSKDKGVSWEQEKLDTDADYLPTQNISMNAAGVLSAKNVENVMLMGTRDKALNDTVATTWLRTVDYDVNAEAGQWNYLEIENNKSGKMPWLDQVITCAADTGFVALGNNGKWYKSQNAGLTWKQDKMVVLPAKFATEGRFAFCRDKQHYYWIIRNGYVWRGRFNIDGWSKED